MDHEDRLKIIESLFFVLPEQIEEELKGLFQSEQHLRLLNFINKEFPRGVERCNMVVVRREFERTEGKAWVAFVKACINTAIKSLGIVCLPRQYRVATQKFNMDKFFVPYGFDVYPVFRILLSAMFEGFPDMCDYPLDYALHLPTLCKKPTIKGVVFIR